MKTKKHLGQNFLKSKLALSKIITAGDLSDSDIVLEIGPGEGILTEELLKKVKKVIAVEKDHRLVEFLEEKFVKDIENKRLEIIEEDILNFDTENLKKYGKNYKLIANIPYYITGEIIKKFLSNRFQPQRIVLLIQKEVAQRIVANNNKESILSNSVKIFGTPKIIDKVKKENFSPQPKVDSAILLIENISKNNLNEIEEQIFFKTVKKGFSQKRKKISNNLDFQKDQFKICNLTGDERAEDLTLKDWICLAKIGLK